MKTGTHAHTHTPSPAERDEDEDEDEDGEEEREGRREANKKRWHTQRVYWRVFYSRLLRAIVASVHNSKLDRPGDFWYILGKIFRFFDLADQARNGQNVSPLLRNGSGIKKTARYQIDSNGTCGGGNELSHVMLL